MYGVVSDIEQLPVELSLHEPQSHSIELDTHDYHTVSPEEVVMGVIGGAISVVINILTLRSVCGVILQGGWSYPPL
jgi:hypothetical protein